MRRWISAACAAAALAGCAGNPPAPTAPIAADDLRIANRLTWGVNASVAAQLAAKGLPGWLEAQLHPPSGDGLPDDVAKRIAEMEISKRSMGDLVADFEQRRKANDAIKDDEKKKAAQQEYQKDLTNIGREAATRSLLRALYSPWQLREQATWFWMNHFNVYQYKSNIRVLVADYEENAIRAHALGHFRDLVMATLAHPAMIRYLDNEQNAARRINENYARELLELHTLGVDGGYTQADVQELARVLTGVGLNRDLLFAFTPARHDPGAKVVLGHAIQPRGGMREIEEVVDMLCRHPATARFVSRKLAVFFVADDPPAALVDRMADTFMRSDGDIAEVLRTMIGSPEFAASLGTKFKDPVHFVVSVVRLAYDDRPILNAAPMIGWLYRMGEAPYNRQTPDGYPLAEPAWSSPGQMNTRFEIARVIGSGSAGLFRMEGATPVDRPAFPRLANALYFQSLERSLGSSTRAALDQATSPQEWNVFLLSSPDMMYR